jgi:hypothetical protein
MSGYTGINCETLRKKNISEIKIVPAPYVLHRKIELASKLVVRCIEHITDFSGVSAMDTMKLLPFVM